MMYMCQFGQNLAIGLEDRVQQTRLLYSYTSLVTLKIRSWSPKFILKILLMVSQNLAIGSRAADKTVFHRVIGPWSILPH